MVSGLISPHMPSSPFFFLYVIALIFVGYLVGAKMDRPV